MKELDGARADGVGRERESVGAPAVVATVVPGKRRDITIPSEGVHGPSAPSPGEVPAMRGRTPNTTSVTTVQLRSAAATGRRQSRPDERLPLVESGMTASDSRGWCSEQAAEWTAARESSPPHDAAGGSQSALAPFDRPDRGRAPARRHRTAGSLDFAKTVWPGDVGARRDRVRGRATAS